MKNTELTTQELITITGGRRETIPFFANNLFSGPSFLAYGSLDFLTQN